MGWEREQQPKKSWFSSALISRQAVMPFSRITKDSCLWGGQELLPSPRSCPQKCGFCDSTGTAPRERHSLGSPGSGVSPLPLVGSYTNQCLLLLKICSSSPPGPCRAGSQPRFLHTPLQQGNILILTQTLRNSAGARNVPVLQLLFRIQKTLRRHIS